eukprot:scaffold163782_cov32-Tisochrysis_lutea.AAC.3
MGIGWCLDANCLASARSLVPHNVIAPPSVRMRIAAECWHVRHASCISVSGLASRVSATDRECTKITFKACSTAPARAKRTKCSSMNAVASSIWLPLCCMLSANIWRVGARHARAHESSDWTRASAIVCSSQVIGTSRSPCPVPHSIAQLSRAHPHALSPQCWVALHARNNVGTSVRISSCVSRVLCRSVSASAHWSEAQPMERSRATVLSASPAITIDARSSLPS